MTNIPELPLTHHLKTLRLPTFLREYDKQARICAAEGVDHVRYPLPDSRYTVSMRGRPGWLNWN